MFRISNARKALDKKKRLNREWLVRPGTERMKADDLGYIEEDIESHAPAARLNIADSLGRLAAWYGTVGQIEVLDGSADGWAEIHRSWLYSSLALRIRIAVFQKGRVLAQFRPSQSLEIEASPCALSLAWALVTNRKFEVEFFGDSLRVMLLDKTVVRGDYWDYHCLEPFTVQLHSLCKNDQSAQLTQSLGRYQSVIDAWNMPSALAKAIHEVCDEHCSRIEYKSNDFPAEFRHPPFDLVPAEILAVYAVRRGLGLETPIIEHPLLEDPFNAPVGDPSTIEDPLLDRVEASF